MIVGRGGSVVAETISGTRRRTVKGLSRPPVRKEKGAQLQDVIAEEEEAPEWRRGDGSPDSGCGGRR